VSPFAFLVVIPQGSAVVLLLQLPFAVALALIVALNFWLSSFAEGRGPAVRFCQSQC
jgi:hypothetical protein